MGDPPPSRVPGALRAFAHRDFRLFFCGQGVSLIGTWMQSVAQSWLVLELTNSPFRLGLVGTLQFAPVLFLSFFAGALADRLPKRRLLIATQSLMCAQALVLAALVTRGHVQYWHVALMAAVYGLANTVDMPTRQAFIVEMVGRESLRSAIALNSTLFNGARVVGPALAGLVIARWGTGLAFFFNGVSFLAVIAALAMLHASGRPRPSSGRSLRDEIAEGLTYALRTPRIAFVLSLVLCVSAFFFNYNTLVPLLARDILHQDAHGFGLLMTAVGGGAVAGAIALASLGTERPPATVLVGSAVALGVATILVAGVSRFGVAMALLTVMGFCGMVFMTGANTTVQLTVPDELRGRVMALHTLMFAGMTPFGAFLVGTVTEALGARAGFLVTGAGGLVSVVAVSLWWRWYRRRR
ncbi:MAG: MFS transporter [Candidatus Rokuibacteriota bacterium]|nr:MAG: MFS transporter [Candidatus Rokubacteria bacterium]